MTTPWKPAGEWRGATVAILATGPSMSAELAETLREHRTIAVNRAAEVAPWADMLLALDGNWPQAWRDFAGMRVTGVADASLDARYIGPRYERVVLEPGRVVHIRSSGIAAVRVAAEMGAAAVILAGFDHPRASGHFYGGSTWGERIGQAEGLAVVVCELQQQGIEVRRVGG